MNLYKWKVLCYELFAKSQQAKLTNSSVSSKKFINFVIVSIIAPVKVSMMPSAPTTAVLPPPPPTAIHRPKIGFSIDSIVGGEGGGGESKKHQNSKISHNHSDHEEEEIRKLKSFQRSQRLSSTENEKNGNNSSTPSSPDPCCKETEERFARVDLKPTNLPYPFPLHHLNNNNSIGNGPIRPIPFPIHPQRQLPHLLHPAYASINNSISSGGGGVSNNSSNNHHDKAGDNNSAVNNRASSTSSRSPSPSNESRKSPLPDSPPLSRPGSSASVTETTTIPGSNSPINHNINPSTGHPVNPLHPSFPSMPGQRPQISPGMMGPQGLPPPFGGYPPGVLNFAAAAAAAHHHPGLPPPWAQHPHQHHPASSHPLYPWLLARQSRMFPHRFGPGPELSGFLFQPFRKPKRIRTAFTPNQLLRLEHAFEKNHYVVGTERKQLAKTLSLSETQVKVWFQNRRTKHKRSEQEEQSEKKYGNRSDLPSSGSNLSSSATSADSTRNYSEGMSDDDEEIVMDEEYSDEEEMAAAMHHNFHRT